MRNSDHGRRANVPTTQPDRAAGAGDALAIGTVHIPTYSIVDSTPHDWEPVWFGVRHTACWDAFKHSLSKAFNLLLICP